MCQGNISVCCIPIFLSIQIINHIFFIFHRSPARLVDLSVILLVDKNQGHNCSDDMALFRL